MLLAGDLGGTKTLLGLFRQTGTARPDVVVTHRVRRRSTSPAPPTSSTAFLAEDRRRRGRHRSRLLRRARPGDRSARPADQRRLDRRRARAAGARCSLKRVHLLNDLEAMAYVVPVLRDDELLVLQKGTRNPHGNGALLAAGTGLGQALLINVDGDLAAVAVRRRPRRLRGADAARDRAAAGADPRSTAGPTPSTSSAARAWSTWRASPARAAVVRLPRGRRPADLPSRITQAALEQRCPHCVEALELWISAFGAAAGNFAMQGWPPAASTSAAAFRRRSCRPSRRRRSSTAFNAKEPFDGLMRDMPVSIILNNHAGLDGAAVYANTM